MNRKVAIVIAVVVGGVIVLNLVAGGIDRAVGGREPSGVAGSSYGTQDTGLAGLTALLAHYGHPVTRARGETAGLAFDPADTVFVIEPTTLTAADDAQLLEFVTAGGRLVIGGSDPFYVRNLRDRAPTWSPAGEPLYQEIDQQFGAVGTISTAARGSWDDAGAGRVLVREGRTALLTADHAGGGEIYFLADTSPLENAYLADADNAAFALGLAGDTGRRVVFVEGVHGYGEHGGLGALPTSWQITLALLALAAVVFAWARARRFGGPDRPSRDLPPARAEYVRALAVNLERTRDPKRALAPMQQWARDRIAQAAHLTPDATHEAIDRAAIALGCDEAERRAVWYPTVDDDTALALGRLVARLSQHDGRTT